ncbi:MAG: hypothetical protein ABJF11_10355 [Reichenbachiella sp.]|uniref:hypothetical protein n=1 Tax=Reichenbachiella sp. TaxID=2184521 RepID=UPI003267BB73
MNSNNQNSIFIGLILLLMLSSVHGYSQQYDRSAGIRLGGSSGLTFKKFIVEEEAFEVIISNRKHGIQLTGLYLIHQPMDVSFNDNFYFYYGVGGHVGAEKHGDISKVLFDSDPSIFMYEEKSYLTLGIDGMIGIEYRMLSVPITLSLDLKPYLNYVGMRKIKADFWDASIAIKYVF